MKRICFILTGLLLLSLAAPNADAAKDKKKERKVDLSAKFDKDRDGKLSDDEKETIRKAFESLKQYDKNSDGKLDDEELNAIKPVARKKKDK
ncbi:MAG: hypothetical protein AB1705_03190 [Verrucomicrobiota bacterium]